MRCLASSVEACQVASRLSAGQAVLVSQCRSCLPEMQALLLPPTNAGPPSLPAAVQPASNRAVPASHQMGCLPGSTAILTSKPWPDLELQQRRASQGHQLQHSLQLAPQHVCWPTSLTQLPTVLRARPRQGRCLCLGLHDTRSSHPASCCWILEDRYTPGADSANKQASHLILPQGACRVCSRLNTYIQPPAEPLGMWMRAGAS